jgi:hypothetical protein
MPFICEQWEAKSDNGALSIPCTSLELSDLRLLEDGHRRAAKALDGFEEVEPSVDSGRRSHYPAAGLRHATSIGFYRDLLGFAVTGTAPKLSDNPDDANWTMLQLNDATLMLNTAYEPEYRPERPEADRFGGHRDTCLYFGCPDVEATYRHFLDKGLAVKEPKVAPYGMKQLYLSDPDGYVLCFQWRA